ncbi:ATP-binding protein [Tamlana flava]|uniref:ATP-binding protein n=1 Tax=Tamlana flava TaxID=3158572 RepID=UPI00351B57FA
MAVKGIPAYLDSIILNFLRNAIKYGSDIRKPEIKLSTHKENEYVVLKIVDNGKGIDMEKYVKNLFQMYKTLHSNKDAIVIGLFITKNHIESLGVKVEVQSQVEVGTKFSTYFKRA